MGDGAIKPAELPGMQLKGTSILSIWPERHCILVSSSVITR